jgi:hypothetical protein
MPDLKRVLALLCYEPKTGVFTRRVSTGGQQAGSVCGSIDSRGYVQIKIDGKCHLAHRLAWLVMTGEWPSGEVDHVNFLRADNRFANLRHCTRALNAQHRSAYKNNSSGFPGVSFDKKAGKWRAYIRVEGRLLYLGFYDSAAAANEKRIQAKSLHHPFAIQVAGVAK